MLKFSKVSPGTYAAFPFTVQKVAPSNWLLLIDEGGTDTWCNSFATKSAAVHAANSIEDQS